MLIGVDPRLNAELLYVLRAMGHGDALVLCDMNFPADSVAQETVHGELLRMENLSSGEAVRAILSVLPLDTFVEDFAGRMEVVGKPHEVPPVQQAVQSAIDEARGCPSPMVGVERFAFYDFAKQAYAVVQTGERRFFGCFFLRKGVIPPVE